MFYSSNVTFCYCIGVPNFLKQFKYHLPYVNEQYNFTDAFN